MILLVVYSDAVNMVNLDKAGKQRRMIRATIRLKIARIHDDFRSRPHKPSARWREQVTESTIVMGTG